MSLLTPDELLEMRPPCLSIAIVNSQRDAPYAKECLEHLGFLSRSGTVSVWSSDQVPPGHDRLASLAAHIHAADVVVALLSVDLFSTAEIERMLGQRVAVGRWIVPVLVRDVHLAGSALANLPLLPHGRKAMARWRHRDQAWLEVVSEIRQLIGHPERAQALLPLGYPSKKQRQPSRRKHVIVLVLLISVAILAALVAVASNRGAF